MLSGSDALSKESSVASCEKTSGTLVLVSLLSDPVGREEYRMIGK